MKRNWRSLVAGFIQNTVAYALPVFLQQFVVYPLMASKLGVEANGQFLALIALNYFVIGITVSVLSSVRLLRHTEYADIQEKGDFNLLLLVFAVINAVTVIGGTIYYGGRSVSPLEILLSVVVVLLFVYQNYIVVQYRVELRFKNILINNLLLCIGYLLGLGVMYFIFPHWQMVFIVPYAITAVYDYTHTDYIREPIRTTPLFRGTLKKYFVLLSSSLLASMVTYGDRLLLYPLMDGATVSIFTTAQLVGKILQMVATPVSGFLLAHMANQKKFQFQIKWYYLMAFAGVCIICYLGMLVISRPLIGFLYADWAEQSMQYVPLTVVNGVLHMVVVMLNVFVLRFCNTKWQLVESVVYLAVYMVAGFTLLQFFGLWGFCLGIILASCMELMVVLIALLKEKVLVFAGVSRKE